jgi:hypothetical protein
MLSEFLGLLGFQAIDELMQVAVIMRRSHISSLRPSRPVRLTQRDQLRTPAERPPPLCVIGMHAADHERTHRDMTSPQLEPVTSTVRHAWPRGIRTPSGSRWHYWSAG